MAVGGLSTGETSSRRFNSTSSFHHKRVTNDDMSATSSTLSSMVSNATVQQQQHAMLSAQSYYATAAAIVSQSASTQLLVHHPGYHHNHTNHHSHQHHNNNNNNTNGHPHYHQQANMGYQTNSDIISSSTSSNSSESNGHTGANDLPPDRPIGYGAFGVVWSVTDPRDGKRVALKKMPNVFQNLISSKRVYREIKMLCFFKHENVLSALDILQPPVINFFQEIYVITELMQSDLHKIIVSSQPLTTDHIKVFLYQILRGLKYLHSAKILHRDIKPGNLLVNSNCLLKICDFGLARVEESDRSRNMTQEVVTQYYRAPELLMGARFYTEAIDMWSVGCIFAELLGRRILFQAQTPIQQLELITDLLGTPNSDDMKYACDAARVHVLRQPYKSPSLGSLYNLSSQATTEAVHLLCQMLSFNPDKRINCTAALNHSYLSEGRTRYHSCMCKCCYTVADVRRYMSDLEPISPVAFDNSFEKELPSVHLVKERLHKEIMQKCLSSNRVPLCINPLSASFKNFASSTVAHPSELPPSPHCWE